jgi:branched-subunit amino acid aminotransferase/4-amino-4-deoxychorismate lyase
MQVQHGTIFALKEHLHRLDRSARLLELPLPADLNMIEKWCHEVITANDAAESTLRLTVIGAEAEGPSTAYLWPQRPTIFPSRYYEEGVSVATFEGQRFMPEAKSLNTLVSFLARRRAWAAGAHEGLLWHDDLVTEGSSSNVFAVQDDVLVTPPAHQVLSGVTRDLVIGLARSDGIRVSERPLPFATMTEWSECFITSTSRHVMPVSFIDQQPVGKAHVGPLTRRLMTLFESCFHNAVECLERVP